MKKAVINKGSSPRDVVGDLRFTESYYKKDFSLCNTTRSAEDSRQRHSGMTSFFHEKAFTLIELLVVVLIIGILSAIALPQYQKAVIKSRYASLKALVRAIADAEERYYLENNEYTNDFDSLDVHTPAYLSETPGVHTTRRFSWGQCTLASQVEFTCHSALADIEYGIRFLHAGNYQRCVAFNTDLSSMQNQICKVESQKNTPQVRSQEHNYTEWTW